MIETIIIKALLSGDAYPITCPAQDKVLALVREELLDPDQGFDSGMLSKFVLDGEVVLDRQIEKIKEDFEKGIY